MTQQRNAIQDFVDRREVERSLSYLDANSPFFTQHEPNIASLEYKQPFTSVSVGTAPTQVHTWAHHAELQRSSAATIAPREAPQARDAVSEAMTVLLDLPLGIIPKRHFPPPQQRVLEAGGSGLQQLAPKPAKANMAQAKWGLVSFHNPEVIQLHRDVTETVLDHRLAYRHCNTRCTFPDVVPEEALSYYRPRDEFGSDWEMFDAKKHIRVDDLARVAKQRRSQAALDEFCKNNIRRSTSRSPSALRRSTSQPRDNHVPQQASSPHAADVKDAAVSILSSVDVRQLVPDDEIPKLFEPDLVKEEIAKLQWDFQAFRPPEEWRKKHQQTMKALAARAEAWRPLKLVKEPIAEDTSTARVTSMPALAPFFSCGLNSVDPKHPVPASSHGSGVPTSILRSGHLANEYVIRQQAAQRNQSGVLIEKAPVIVQGMKWGDILASQEL